MKTIYSRAVLALFFSSFFGLGCENDDAKLERLFRDFSRSFYQRFPDSAAVVGLRIAAEKCLEPPSRAIFEANFRWLEQFEIEIKTLETTPFSTENARKRKILIQKTTLLKKRLEPEKVDASLFDIQKIWLGVFENSKISEAERFDFFEKTLERMPAFLAGAQSLGADFFDPKSFEKAEIETRATFFFLKEKEPAFSKNTAFQNGLLALKNWMAFCESARKTTDR